MEEIRLYRLSTWDVQNPVNTGISTTNLNWWVCRMSEPLSVWNRFQDGTWNPPGFELILKGPSNHTKGPAPVGFSAFAQMTWKPSSDSSKTVPGANPIKADSFFLYQLLDGLLALFEPVCFLVEVSVKNNRGGRKDLSLVPRRHGFLTESGTQGHVRASCYIHRSWKR